MINSTKNQDKGFTLVELLIVIVILGILATVTVFAVTGVTDTAETNACQVEEKNLETAVQSYFASNTTDAIPFTAPATAYDTLKTANLLNPDFVEGQFTLDGTGAIGSGTCTV